MTGAVALPTDGPTWQAMRLSRNRRWGNPAMIALLERFSQDAVKYAGWPGILVGDIAQPRGGPMLNGHSSHQIGLDADIWFTPMPARRMTPQEREDLPFTSMLQKDKFLTVNPKVWSQSRARLLMLAASYPEVERIFVNPAIKKKMCDTWTATAPTLASSGRYTAMTRISTSASNARPALPDARRKPRSPPETAATSRSPIGSRRALGAAETTQARRQAAEAAA